MNKLDILNEKYQELEILIKEYEDYQRPFFENQNEPLDDIIAGHWDEIDKIIQDEVHPFLRQYRNFFKNYDENMNSYYDTCIEKITNWLRQIKNTEKRYIEKYN